MWLENLLLILQFLRNFQKFFQKSNNLIVCRLITNSIYIFFSLPDYFSTKRDHHHGWCPLVTKFTEGIQPCVYLQYRIDYLLFGCELQIVAYFLFHKQCEVSGHTFVFLSCLEWEYGGLVTFSMFVEKY